MEEKVNLLTTLIPNLDSRLQSADSKGTQRNLGREATRDGSKKKKKKRMLSLNSEREDEKLGETFHSISIP